MAQEEDNAHTQDRTRPQPTRRRRASRWSPSRRSRSRSIERKPQKREESPRNSTRTRRWGPPQTANVTSEDGELTGDALLPVATSEAGAKLIGRISIPETRWIQQPGKVSPSPVLSGSQLENAPKALSPPAGEPQPKLLPLASSDVVKSDSTIPRHKLDASWSRCGENSFRQGSNNHAHHGYQRRWEGRSHSYRQNQGNCQQNPYSDQNRRHGVREFQHPQAYYRNGPASNHAKYRSYQQSNGNHGGSQHWQRVHPRSFNTRNMKSRSPFGHCQFGQHGMKGAHGGMDRPHGHANYSMQHTSGFPRPPHQPQHHLRYPRPPGPPPGAVGYIHNRGPHMNAYASSWQQQNPRRFGPRYPFNAYAQPPVPKNRNQETVEIEEPSTDYRWDSSYEGSWFEPWRKRVAETEVEAKARLDLVTSFAERQRDILDSGLRDVAKKLEMRLDSCDHDNITEDASQKVSLLQRMLNIMCNENDSDFGCSDSEDEMGKRRKPLRITNRMKLNAFEELKKRAALNTRWRELANKKGVLVNPFPIAAGSSSSQPGISKLDEANEPVNEAPRKVAINWNSKHNQPDMPKDPRLVFQNSVEDTKATQTATLQLPSCSWKKFIVGFHKRINISRRLILQPNEHRIHIPGTPREPVEGSHKFKYLTAAGDTSCSRYDETTVHNLSNKRMSNGRKMGVPHSVMYRSEDNLWLHHNETPHKMHDLVDQVRIGRPLQAVKDWGDLPADGKACTVALELFWNEGLDKIDCPLLVRLIYNYAAREIATKNGCVAKSELCPITRIKSSKRKTGWTSHDHQLPKKAKCASMTVTGNQDCGEPMLLRVDPGHQHIGRLAGHIGLDVLRNTKSQNTIRCLLESAMELIKTDSNMVGQVEKLQRSKPGLGSRGVPGSLKRKSQTVTGPPNKRRPPALSHEALPCVGKLKNLPSPSTTKVLQKGRVAPRQALNHAQISNAQEFVQGNGALPIKQEKKSNGFSTDGASVADWIANCTFRSVTLEEQEAAKEESRYRY